MHVKQWSERYYDPEMEYVLITGASSGIGYQYLRAFADIGCRCIATSEDEATLAQVVDALRTEKQVEIVEFVADLGCEEGVEALVEFLKPFKIAAMVSNAGFGMKGPFISHDAESYSSLVHLNALAPTLIARHVLPTMIAAERGLVIHVASVNACTPIAFNAVYTATKVYLLYYAYAVAYELKDTPLRFQVVLPGTTNTPFHERQGAVPQAMFMEPDVVVNRSLARIDRTICISNYTDRLLYPIVSALPYWASIRVGTFFLKKRLKIGDGGVPTQPNDGQQRQKNRGARRFSPFGIKMRWYPLLALGLFAVAFGYWRATASEASTDGKPPVLPVSTVRTRTKPGFSYPIAFYGRIQSVRHSSLSFEIPGQVASLVVDEGENVEADQPMARLNTSILESEKEHLVASRRVEQTTLRRLEKGERDEVIAAARAMVSRAEAETERATLDLDRITKLRESRTASQSEYEEALCEAKSLEASLDVARARLRELETGTREEDIEAQKHRIAALDAQVALLEVRLDKATLSAPFPAHVTSRMVDEGVVLREGAPVYVVAEVGRHEARFSLPIDQLDEARAATSIDVDNRQVAIGGVRVISAVSPETRTVDVVFELNDSASLIEGQTCSLTLTEIVQTECVGLPISALVPSVRGLWSCYRLVADEVHDTVFRVLREEVSIVHSTGDRVFVESSLPDGSLVVREGVHKLVPGMLIRVRQGES